MQVDSAPAARSFAPGTFMVGRMKLAPGETLAPDPSTYRMLHKLSTPWPCLSFDIVHDGLGDTRNVYPATMYLVTGTQAASGQANDNQLLVMKFSGLSKTGGVESDSDEEDDDNNDDEDDDDDEDADPIIESRAIPLNSTTNRIRAHQTPSQDLTMPPTTITASMTESAQVLIHDVTSHLTSFDNPGTLIGPKQNKPICTLRVHKTEGYALDWSPLHGPGRLVTGDNDGLIYLTARNEGGGFTIDSSRPFRGHDASVEDLQWSPSEASVFASSSADGTVRVWDVRSKSRTPAISMRVSATDVNVMSWSPLTQHLMATGDEAGEWAVWDLRQWKPTAAASAPGRPTPLANFGYTKPQITR